MKAFALADTGVAAKLTAVTVASAAITPHLNDITRPFIGASLTVLVASAGGAIAAFAYFGEPNRKKLFGMAAVNAFLAAALVTVVPLWLGWAWLTPEVKTIVEAPMCFLTAFALRWGVPLFVEVGPQWVRNKYGKPSGGLP